MHIPSGRYYYGIHDGDPTDGYMGSGAELQRLMARGGRGAFSTRAVAAFLSREDAEVFERVLVDARTVASKQCLNQCVGGGGTRGYKFSAADKRATSKGIREYWRRRRLSKAMKAYWADQRRRQRNESL